MSQPIDAMLDRLALWAPGQRLQRRMLAKNLTELHLVT